MATGSACDLPHQFFFFNATATTEIYTLTLHDALPISAAGTIGARSDGSTTTSSPAARARAISAAPLPVMIMTRSEEHTSELQSRSDLVCRLLLEKKKPDLP